MFGSVRSRLTAVVVVTVGGLTLIAALVAPRAVHTALVDDRLDAEVDGELAALDPMFTAVAVGAFGQIGAPELTTLFGPQIVALTDALEPSGAVARLRSFDDGGLLRVTPMADVVGTVEASGQVRVELADYETFDGPLISMSQLSRLAGELNGGWYGEAYGDLFNVFQDGTLTFEDFLTDLDDRFGTTVEDRLDTSVFEGLPPIEIGDGGIPRAVFEILQNDLPTISRAIQPTPTARLDDYIFGVRSAGGTDVIVSASAEGIDRSVERVRNLLWFSLPITMLLAGALTWLLAGRALRPVKAITEQTGRIRSSTLHERVPVPAGRDEIAGLATEMNTMLDRVQSEDRRRRQFVADASHELRSPIAALRTQAEATLTTTDDPDVIELATGVLAESTRMGTLVDDLLSLARHDEAQAPPGVVLDLDDIVLAEASRPRRVPIDVRGVSAGRVRGRPDELARVVTHLLDNAARHAAASVIVALATVRSDGQEMVRLTVDDDGPGIPEDQRQNIFERFVRLDEARQRDNGGAGLGLAVVAAVVDAAGGTVAADVSPSGGARFEVALPVVS